MHTKFNRHVSLKKLFPLRPIWFTFMTSSFKGPVDLKKRYSLKLLNKFGQ